jgi:hypothetical protein
VDLLLPGNFIVVEGGSDETIVERAVELLGGRPGSVKTLSADGLSKVPPTAASIEYVLRPIVTGDSPYSRSTVVLVDGALTDADRQTTAEMRRILGERFLELPSPSLEEYLPAELYQKAGLEKDVELGKIRAAGHSYKEHQRAKGELAGRIAGVMDRDDLDTIPVVRDAADRALHAKTAGGARRGVTNRRGRENRRQGSDPGADTEERA